MDVGSVLSGRGGPNGVRAALVRGPLRRAARAGLASLLADPGELGPCRLRRTKFKPGRKLTAYFDVGVPGPSSRAAAVAWHVGAAPTADGAAIEDDARARGLAGPFRRLGTTTDGMRLTVFPLDPAFPRLVPLADPAHLVDAGVARQPPRIDPVRYRPGQRHVLRYGDGPTTLFAKLYAGGEGAHRASVAEGVADVLADMGCAAARPAAYLEDDDAVLVGAVRGSTLASLVRAGEGRTGDVVERAGAMLARLHAAEPTLAGGRPARDLAHELAAVSRIAASVAPVAPDAGAAVDAVQARTAELAGELPPPAAAFVHGDYKADHLLVGPTTTLIDFDRCGVGDPALDVAKFLADLRWWTAAGGETTFAAAEQRFLTGYRGDEATLARARGLEPLWSVKLAGRRLPVHREGWAVRLVTIADAARRRLDRVWSAR